MSQDNGILVEAKGLDRIFRRGAEEIHVLNGLDLTIPRAEFLALMGPSGSGKTTLLNLIGGLDKPSAGTVDVGGLRISELGSGRLADDPHGMQGQRQAMYICAEQMYLTWSLVSLPPPCATHTL